jgi:hypothetical protein
MVITLAAASADSYYLTRQIARLRALQTDLADRNREDSLQLLRIQNDLNSLGLAMRDMLDSDEPYPLTAWSAQFQRVRLDLEDAFPREEQLAVATRTPEQRQYLADSLAQFWDASDRIFALARGGHEADARAQIRLSLQARQAALGTAVARLLVDNNASEERQRPVVKRRAKHELNLARRRCGFRHGPELRRVDECMLRSEAATTYVFYCENVAGSGQLPSYGGQLGTGISGGG